MPTHGNKQHGKPAALPLSGSITLDQGDPHLGDAVTFTVTGAGDTILLYAYRLGIVESWMATGAVGSKFILGGTDSAWRVAGGPADCYAYLYASGQLVAGVYFAAQGAR